MTRHEKRVLYLLTKYQGSARRSQITQGMARQSAIERGRALAAVEDLGLVSSGRKPLSPGKGGTGGLVYWLTTAGREAVDDLIERGELKDPTTEPRARR